MKQSDLDNLCYSFIFGDDGSHHVMTIPEAAYTLNEWQQEGGELAEQTADVSAKQLSETWNRVLAQFYKEFPNDVIREALAKLKFAELVDVWNEFVRNVNERELSYLPQPPWHSYYLRPMDSLDEYFDGCSATYILDTLDHVHPHDLYFYYCDDPFADAYDQYASCATPNDLDDFPYWNHINDLIRYIIDEGDALHSEPIAVAISAVRKLDTIPFEEE